MKICWDNLEGLRYSKKTGKWYNGNGGGYIEKDKCKNCGEPFLSREGKSDFCCFSCRSSGKHNGMYGKTHTDEVKEKSRKRMKNLNNVIKDKYSVENISQLDWIKKRKNQFVVNFNNVSSVLLKEGYILLSLEGTNKSSVLLIQCPEGHMFKMKWHSWKRGHRCVQCYHDKLRENGIQDKEGYELYKHIVYRYTQDTYKKYKDTIDPDNKRSKEWHLDHKYSIYSGYINNVPPQIIGSIYNLEIIECSLNCSKQEKNSLTKGELISEYNNKNR